MSAFGEPLIPLLGYVLGGTPLMVAREQTQTQSPTTLVVTADKHTSCLSTKGAFLGIRFYLK